MIGSIVIAIFLLSLLGFYLYYIKHKERIEFQILWYLNRERFNKVIIDNFNDVVESTGLDKLFEFSVDVRNIVRDDINRKSKIEIDFDYMNFLIQKKVAAWMFANLQHNREIQELKNIETLEGTINNFIQINS